MFPPVGRRSIRLYHGEFLDILRLLLSGRLIRGPHVALFSTEFARYVGARDAILTSTGRSALEAILAGLDLPPGGEVIMPAYEDLSVPTAVRDRGFKPVFVDIDPMTQGLDPAALSRRMTDATVAVIVAHLFGIPCDVGEVVRIARPRGIAVIEDCAHALGTRAGGIHVGTQGDASFFSFHSTKPFMTFGGGAVATNDPRLAENIRAKVAALPPPSSAQLMLRILTAYALAALSQGPLFQAAVFPALVLLDALELEPIAIYDALFRPLISVRRRDAGFSNMQAYVGLKNLGAVDGAVRRRTSNARILDQQLNPNVFRPAMAGGNYYFYVILTDGARTLRSRLLKNGIDTGKDLMRFCPAHFGASEQLANARRALDQSVQIPVHEGMTSAQMRRLAKTVQDVACKVES